MNSDTAAVSAKPAAYGQSCANCVRAKCKCMVRNANDSCERCHRLRKECRLSTTIRKRNTKRSTALKHARLKTSVDNAKTPLNKRQNVADHLSLNNSTPAPADDPVALGQTAWGINDSSATATSATGLSAPSVYQSRDWSPINNLSDIEASSFEAEDALNRFRNFSATQYPFVYIAPDISAQELEKSKPFLWLCIKAVSCLSLSKQKALGSRVREIIAQKMLIENERSVDLLLGLLVYTGRANNLMQGHRTYFSLFTQMAQAVVFDLGLNKPIYAESANVPPCIGPSAIGAPSPSSMKLRTTEERRAVLGCYYITSVIAGYAQRIDGLCWTPHMAQSLQMLTEKPECSQDTVLVLLIRTRLIADKMANLSCNGQLSQPSTSIMFCMRALNSELQEIRHDISRETERSVSYASQLSIYHTQLIIWDSTIVDGRPLADIFTADPSRLEGLFKCLEAIKSWFDLALDIPATNYVFPLFSPLTHFIFALHKLSTLQAPGWSIEFVKDAIDLSRVLHRLVQKFEHAQYQTSLTEDPSASEIFGKGVIFLKYMKNMLEPRSTEVVTPDPQAGDATITDAGTEHKDQMEEAVFPIEFSDDTWLTELLATMQY